MALLERFPALHRSIGFGASLYLEGMSQFQRNIVISAFAQAVRECTFSKRNKEHLAQGTVNAPPSHMHHGPSGQTLGMAPNWTPTVRLASSCKNNGEDARTKTRIGRSRKPSQPLSSGRCTK